MEPVLVIGYGNPGRLDDGLGPALAGALEEMGLDGVEIVSDYQLSAEHAADIADFGTVIFADAAVAGREPFFFRRLRARPALSFSTHSIRPEALLALARDALGWEGTGYLLGVRGYAFNEFGEKLSERARANLAEAARWLAEALRSGGIEKAMTNGPIDDSARLCVGGDACTTAST